jgi:TrmH family RNA methyltransferase
VDVITSPSNPAVRAARKLARPSSRARAGGRFLLEGPEGIRSALDAGHVPDSLLATERAAARHAGLVNLARQRGTQVALVAGNAGTVLRAADAFGADAVATTSGSVDPESPKAARAAAGSLFHLPVIAGVPWPRLRTALRQRGLRLVGADPHAVATVDRAPLSDPVALVLGNEAHGLPDQVAADLDLVVRVPLAGRAESLNLAAAAAVLLYEATRRRTATEGSGEPQGGAPENQGEAAVGR